MIFLIDPPSLLFFQLYFGRKRESSVVSLQHLRLMVEALNGLMMQGSAAAACFTACSTHFTSYIRFLCKKPLSCYFSKLPLTATTATTTASPICFSWQQRICSRNCFCFQHYVTTVQQSRLFFFYVAKFFLSLQSQCLLSFSLDLDCPHMRMCMISVTSLSNMK